MKGWDAMKSIIRGAALGLLLAAGGAGAAIAGSGNVLYLTQTNTGPDVNSGNQFFSDQSHANYSSIGQPGNDATQTGERNDANLTIKSDCARLASSCGTLGLTQDNSAAGFIAANTKLTTHSQGAVSTPAALQGNVANVKIFGQGNATVSQLGDDNLAQVELDDGTALIDQAGLTNTAQLKLNGDANGTINQLGSNNLANFQVSATNGATVTLNQHGNSNTYVPGSAVSYTGNASAPPITVQTNGSVTISQWHM
jgi:hypothetical protein